MFLFTFACSLIFFFANQFVFHFHHFIGNIMWLTFVSLFQKTFLFQKTSSFMLSINANILTFFLLLLPLLLLPLIPLLASSSFFLICSLLPFLYFHRFRRCYLFHSLLLLIGGFSLLLNALLIRSIWVPYFRPNILEQDNFSKQNTLLPL